MPVRRPITRRPKLSFLYSGISRKIFTFIANRYGVSPIDRPYMRICSAVVVFEDLIGVLHLIADMSSLTPMHFKQLTRPPP
jgi:hypothetical protein